VTFPDTFPSGHGMHFASHGNPKQQQDDRIEMVHASSNLKITPLPLTRL